MYAQGKIGKAPDFEKAYELYAKACLAGASERCLQAGYFAIRGKGTPVNKAMSEKLFRKGCDLRDGDSCNSLGISLADASASDSGTFASMPNADRKEIYDLLNQACELGNGQGCKNLVRALSNQIKVELTKEADTEMEKLCKKGIVEGCLRLYLKQ